MRRIEAMTTCLILATAVGCSHPAAKVSTSWNRRAAATYLDNREVQWTQWIAAARGQGTYCTSCHTVLPYAFARPALRTALAEQGPSETEKAITDNVVKRVRLWKSSEPYYSDQGYNGKTAESRGTESVLNALMLANADARAGHLSGDTRMAFEYMWAQELKTGGQKGSWPWLQFDQEPWEAKDSVYYGACLAALAVGIAPEDYASSPKIQDDLKLLRDYLHRESASQSTINHAFLLWASTKLSGVLGPQQKKDIVDELLSKQQTDGGWRLASIAWSWHGWSLRSLVNVWIREDGTPLEGKSDGLATGLITFVLQEAGVPRSNLQLENGLNWLMNNQNAEEGFWPALSVNKRKHISSNTGRFMSDAATAFSVLSLTESERTSTPVASASN